MKQEKFGEKIPGNQSLNDSKNVIMLVYDGECPLCSASARALKIKKAVGNLNIINAREDHPIVEKINQAGLNLDKGMVVKFNDKLYHGADAQHLLAMIGTNSDWLNQLNIFLFRSKFLTILTYPFFKAIRRILLKLKGVPNIDNLHKTSQNNQPALKSVFGANWEYLPLVMQKHYANRPFSEDKLVIEGKLDIVYSGIFRVLSPIFQFFRVFAPAGKNIPVKVILYSLPSSSYLYFDRTFFYTGKKPYHFRSYMFQIKDNILVELAAMGFGFRMMYLCENDKIILQHKGYVCRIFRFNIPLPLRFLLGTISLEKQAISPDTFRVKMQINHPLGKYAYSGILTILDRSL